MTTLNSLQKIIPPDQALANKALERSLSQIKNVFNVDLQTFAPVVEQLESTYDLPLVQALTEPIPQSVKDFYSGNIATGTGPNGTLTVYDMIGTAAGATHNTEIPIVTQVLQDLDNDGELDVLTANAGPTSSSTGVYTVMQYCLSGTYTSVVSGPPDEYTVIIPSGVYGAGSYGPYGSANAAIDAAFSGGLIPAAANLIAAIAAANSELASQANSAFDASAEQLAIEDTNRALANIDFANLEANAQSVTMSIVSNLHDIGLDTTEGGSAVFFENISDQSTLSGQSVIASMREGRNIRRLNDIGITLDTQLPDTPTEVTEAELLPSQESVAEATSYAQNNQ